MVAGGLVVLTELELDQSRDAAAAGRIDEAIDRALAARTVQPWSLRALHAAGAAGEADGNFDQALGDLRQAEQRDSEDWRLPVIEARLQSARGDGAAAQIRLRRASALSPVSLLPIIYSSQDERRG